MTIANKYLANVSTEALKRALACGLNSDETNREIAAEIEVRACAAKSESETCPQ